MPAVLPMGSSDSTSHDTDRWLPPKSTARPPNCLWDHGPIILDGTKKRGRSFLLPFSSDCELNLRSRLSA
jgi:hypothetical protein